MIIDLELVTREGMTYFAPAQDRTTKITGLRKWEQAFRVYAAIYTQKHPEHASEIWQDMYVINLAASSLQWENVSFYDCHILSSNGLWSLTVAGRKPMFKVGTWLWLIQSVDVRKQTPQLVVNLQVPAVGGHLPGVGEIIAVGATIEIKCKKSSAQCDWGP